MILNRLLRKTNILKSYTYLGLNALNIMTIDSHTGFEAEAGVKVAYLG